MERLEVGLPYRGLVQKCLKKVKYKSAWEIVSFLFCIWKENCSDTVSRDTVITSVPMWREKERQRGFNQAEIIGKLLARNGRVSYLAMLERTRETRPMFGLKKKERRENVRGAFRVQNQCHSDKVSQIILVDDVWTTGATLRECARVLKEAGVREVWGLTLAG
ncbi:MAG: phosphoribosyltransferase family protein [bacterium]